MKRDLWQRALLASGLFLLPMPGAAEPLAYREPGDLEFRNSGGLIEKDPELDDSGSADPKRETQLFWLQTTPGFEWVRLTSFEAEVSPLPTADLVELSAQGPAVSTGLGLRLGPITLGARGGVAFPADARGQTSGLELWSINGEIGFRFSSGTRFEPYLLIGGGYSVLSGASAQAQGDFEVSGPNARAGLGLDYFASELVSIGLLVSGELLFLTRPGVSASDLLESKKVKTVEEARAQVEQADGTHFGSAISLLVGPSLHFD